MLFLPLLLSPVLFSSFPRAPLHLSTSPPLLLPPLLTSPPPPNPTSAHSLPTVRHLLPTPPHSSPPLNPAPPRTSHPRGPTHRRKWPSGLYKNRKIWIYRREEARCVTCCSITVCGGSPNTLLPISPQLLPLPSLHPALFRISRPMKGPPISETSSQYPTQIKRSRHGSARIASGSRGRWCFIRRDCWITSRKAGRVGLSWLWSVGRPGKEPIN